MKEGNEASAKAEKIGGSHYEGLKKMFEITAGAELGRNLEQLVKFVSLGLRSGAKFGVGDSDRAKPGYG